MIIQLQNGKDFDLSSVAAQFNKKHSMILSISQMGNTVYVHSELTDEQKSDVENMVHGITVATPTKTKKKVAK